MTRTKKQSLHFIAVIAMISWSAAPAAAQDWTQWRGNNRDAVASNFKAPESWPRELAKGWTVEVGDGVSSPSVMGDKLYVMALQDGKEVMRCLNAESGEEIWTDAYDAKAASGPAGGFAGTRSAPAIGQGHVVTMGVDGTVSCWDAESGKMKWRNNDHQGEVPRFSTSSSPVIHDGMCIVQFGGEDKGGIAAYDLETGSEKWAWTENGSSYASPVLMKVGKHAIALAPAATQVVAVSLADGKSLWSMDYTQGRYNAATPVVDGQTVYLAGPNRGITALELTDEGDTIASKEVWRNEDEQTTVQYNTPVMVDGMLYGLSNANQLFCVNAEDGTMTWNSALAGATGNAAPTQRPERGGDQGGKAGDKQGEKDGAERGGDRPAAGDQPQRGGRQRGGRGGGGRGGYGSIVAAGSVLIGLTPTSELFVYDANGKEFKELARYKVSETPTYAYPILVGNRIYVKDKDSLTMWTVGK